MPTDPIGQDTHKGLAAPLFGDATVEQRNSSNYVRTYVHTSDNTGGFLAFSDFRADRASSVLTNLLVADVDEDGGFRAVSGTTVLMELNSSGLYGGSALIVGPSGETVPQVVTINTTASTLVSSNSGKLHLLSTQAATSNFIYLPTSGNARVGDTWEIFSNTTAVGLWNLSILGANTGGEIHVHNGSTNAIATTGAIDSTVTTGGMWWKVLCVSTTPIYFVTNMMTQAGPTTAGNYYTIGAGTTA
jgi:hypothetical protein